MVFMFPVSFCCSTRLIACVAAGRHCRAGLTPYFNYGRSTLLRLRRELMEKWAEYRLG